MLFPNVAKEAVAKTFYDKLVEVYSPGDGYDEEGGIKKGDYTPKCTLIGNVCFTSNLITQAEKGVLAEADVLITCPSESDVAVDDVIKYADACYQVTEVLPYDSHKTILGKKVRGLWLTQ